MLYRPIQRILKDSKWIFAAFIFTVFLFLYIPKIEKDSGIVIKEVFIPIKESLFKPSKNWRNFSNAEIDSLSTLGRILYLEENYPPTQSSKTYKILIWKYGKFLENRHIKHFSSKKLDPFENCSVKNCIIEYNDDEIKTADAVLFHLQRMKGVSDLPVEDERPPNQRWIFLTDETPHNTFFNRRLELSDFNDQFNWSMTYRMDSDIPVPYGRTVLRRNKSLSYNDILDKEDNKRNDILVAILGSNCGSRNGRWEYVKELQKYIDVHVYGNCGTLKCPGHFNKDCTKLNHYKFYLSFENSNCAQYITEKVWWNAYSKNAIPVIMGCNTNDAQKLLPPNSYLHVNEFASPADLARFIIYLNKTADAYNTYFNWKKHYTILNEHGYFQSNSVHYCRICEALNYNSKNIKIYDDLKKFWNANDCYTN